MASLMVQGATDLQMGEMKKFNVSGTDILIANVDGAFYAISNTCTHMGGSLADGILENGIVKCPRHGSQFDVKTGKCVGALTMFFIKKTAADVQAYPLELKDGQIYIQL
jgi:3-phenylpropionate/trans-cinnamate dioxygenase ferredoxin component